MYLFFPIAANSLTLWTPTEYHRIQFNSDTNYQGLHSALRLTAQSHKTVPTSANSHKSRIAPCTSSDQPTINQFPTTLFSGLFIFQKAHRTPESPLLTITGLLWRMHLRNSHMKKMHKAGYEEGGEECPELSAPCHLGAFMEVSLSKHGWLNHLAVGD